MISEILTDEEEQNCEIRIIVRADRWGFNKEFWGIQIDNTITPLYCCSCKTQLKNFYKLNGGRYGQVGTVKCTCEAEINCFDSDNIVEYLDTLTSIDQTLIDKCYIDYTKMYRLNNDSFITIRDKVGFDIYKKYSNQTIDLKQIVEDLELIYGLKYENYQDFRFDKIKQLPRIVNKWLTILENSTK
ncbi:MAG: hypothetical protein ACKVOU_14535 [Cytophagales bacterium]